MLALTLLPVVPSCTAYLLDPRLTVVCARREVAGAGWRMWDSW